MIYSCNEKGGYITATMVSLTSEKAMTHLLTEEEYLRIEAARKEYPRDGRIYQLRTDLTWEPVQDESEEEITAEEILNELEKIL